MMGFYKNGKWQPDAAEIASGEYMEPKSEIAILRERIAELVAENEVLHKYKQQWESEQAMYFRIKALPDKWQEEKVHNPTETGKVRNRWIGQCADELQAALEQKDE
jgi:hypothetical protein